MAKKNEIVSAENNITRKDFRGVFWRSFTLLGSFNYERMEGLGFLFSIMPVLRKIYHAASFVYQCEGCKSVILAQQSN